MTENRPKNGHHWPANWDNSGWASKCKNDVTEHLFSLYPLSKGGKTIYNRVMHSFSGLHYTWSPSLPSWPHLRGPNNVRVAFTKRPFHRFQSYDSSRTKHRTKSSINVFWMDRNGLSLSLFISFILFFYFLFFFFTFHVSRSISSQRQQRSARTYFTRDLY